MVARRLSDQEVMAQLPAARARARALRAQEPRAQRAHYDRGRRLIIVELTNGALFGFPPRLVPGLRGAHAGALTEVEVSPSGEALHWETLDVDLRVPAMLKGIFGTRAWMRQLGQAGGRVRSDAKAAAARANGAKGGRPRRRSA